MYISKLFAMRINTAVHNKNVLKKTNKKEVENNNKQGEQIIM